jgi:hypothetical protein
MRAELKLERFFETLLKKFLAALSISAVHVRLIHEDEFRREALCQSLKDYYTS